MKGRAGKLVVAVVLFLSVWTGASGNVKAIDTFITTNLVVMEGTNLLNDYSKPDSIAGSITGTQNVQVACEPREQGLLGCATSDGSGASYGGKDYILVKTSLGNKWIEDNGRVIYGYYKEIDREITLVDDTKLYELPVGMKSYDQTEQPRDTGQMLAPQKVQVTASVSYMHKWVRTGRGMVESTGTWYRVHTSWVGDKWILDPFIPEDVKEQPTDTPIKLTGEEMLYDYPYRSTGRGEKATPGVIQPIAASIFNMRTVIVVWYKIKQNDGAVKWVQMNPQKNEEWLKFSLPNEKVKIRTATRYFDSRWENPIELQDWLQPGDYIADEVDDGWVHVQTPLGWKWLNLQRAPLERPEGIQLTQDNVMLTPETKTYYFPLTGEICHEKGTFGYQEAQAFEKWTSPQGENWYHIPTYSGIVWLPEKPLPEE
ncbi:hypothetical protein [Paenibacillus radicis (ex Xue et al. 2023)]|uniref:Uncharacterized protein n=1 Tax=Paenibacillus radicis (ex Xue et al. 2023) TaxID=2972489 RepID=A0ABT1YVC5_9BACL|nr:hypothetical protein [Paenibacillus radicis (ex Xue et al. 2023)]MCR8636891.1 hypothetical protein [Paenibacillus radicis (ex Xue et al. 2023)]